MDSLEDNLCNNLAAEMTEVPLLDSSCSDAVPLRKCLRSYRFRKGRATDRDSSGSQTPWGTQQVTPVHLAQSSQRPWRTGLPAVAHGDLVDFAAKAYGGPACVVRTKVRA